MKLAWLIVAAVAALSPGSHAQTTQVQRKEVILALADALESDYVIPEIGRTYAQMLRGRVASVDYAVADDVAFAETVQADLDQVNKDRHLRLIAPPPPSGAASALSGSSSGTRASPSSLAGFRVIEYAARLTPALAYIRFSLFPSDPATLAELERFLAANADVDTLIVDARGHRGGSVGEIDALFAELFSQQIDLVQMELAQAVVDQRPDMLMSGPTFRRIPSQAGMARVQHVTKPAARPRLAHTKLYVLQSGLTGSAAEHFLLEVKMSGRGKLYGETSAGANHFGYAIDLPGGFSSFIPVGRTFDPHTGWDWEGKGVSPDVAAPAQDALLAVLTDLGLRPEEAAALDRQVGFLMPQRKPAGSPRPRPG